MNLLGWKDTREEGRKERGKEREKEKVLLKQEKHFPSLYTLGGKESIVSLLIKDGKRDNFFGGKERGKLFFFKKKFVISNITYTHTYIKHK